MRLLKDRLIEAVTDWEIANNRKFNYSAMGRLCGASKQAIQGWKTGDTKLIKKTSTLMCVAKHLNVDPLWLNEGYGLKTIGIVNMDHDIQGKNFERIDNHNHYVPLITFSQAVSWSTNSNNKFLRKDAKSMIPCSKEFALNHYALKVKGDSMLSSGNNSFPENSIIIIDPSAKPKSNDFVIALIDGEEDAVFKQLAIDGSRQYLKSLNPQYPTIIDKFSILGKAVEIRKSL